MSQAYTADKTEYILQTLKIIPASVSSNSWSNVEHAVVQDLNSDSLIQSFSEENSAYLDFAAFIPVAPDVDEDEKQNQTLIQNVSSNTPDVGTTTDVSIEAEDDIVVAEEDEGEVLQPEETEVDLSSPDESIEDIAVSEEIFVADEEEQSEPESVPEVEPLPENTENETTVLRKATESLFTIFNSVTTIFPFANNTTSSVATEEVVVPEIIIEDTQEEDTSLQQQNILPEETDELAQEDTPTTASSSQEVVVVESEESTPLAVEDAEITSSVATDTAAADIEETNILFDTVASSTTSGTSTQAVVSQETVEILSEPQFVLPDCLPEEGCQSHELLFDGFGVPGDVKNDKYLETMQVRLSLGSQAHANPSSIQKLRVQYTFDESWSDAGLVDLTEENANSINGDYYLFALPTGKTTSVLNTLKIRLLYEGDVAEMKELFVDALWIEVSTGEFFEPEEAEDFTDKILYDRLLSEPSLNEFTSPLSDFAVGANPAFTMRFKSQKNFISRAFNSFFGDRDFEVASAQLTHPQWGALDADFTIEYLDNETWTLQLARPQQKIRPGKYTVVLKMNEGGEVYTDTFEFYWGVLAINTTKSMYTPGEEATLNFAALTDKGDTICNADLRLTITDPLYNITEVPINESGYCGPNNVTTVPDYLATFEQTHEVGEYVMQLQHFNADGALVHKIEDTFEVREYIPFDIERTAPTRIYPPAPYAVTLDITANREFNGVITERLPRGFVLVDAGGGTLTTLEEYNLLSWEASLEEGEEFSVTYRFDAPDISPYLYLLGPLDMDGFTELRQWQIASDALGGVAWLVGTETTAGTDLNAAAARMLWSTSTFDGVYFDHSTSSESYKLDIKKAGDYLIALNVPQERTDGNSSRTRIGAEIRVNGTAVPAGYARSSYIRNASGHTESSSNVQFMLDGLQVDDYVEVYVEGLTTVDAGDDVIVSGQAGMYVEYIAPNETIFAATTTQPIGTTTLNEETPNEMVWTETRQDTGFVHSDSVNPEDIVISNTGSYLVSVNIPLTTITVTGSSTDERNNILGKVLLDGVQVPGGQFAQGYMRGPETESDGESSIHWSGVVTATTTNQVLSISVEREGIDGEVVVTPGAVGSIFIQQLPSTDIILLRGTDLSGGTDWSDTPAESVLWDTQDIYDASVFTHSTSTNTDQITVNQAGDYLLVFNDALNSNTARGNVKITVEVDGTPVSGAETKSQYTRNATNNESSGSLTFLLDNLASSSVVTVHAEQEGANATFNDSVDAIVMLWKKAELNLQPDVPTTYDVPFDNIRYSSTTPMFEFSAEDPDGTSGIIYEISWSTTTNFSASTTKRSNVDLGFSNTASSTDIDPFVEGDRIRYQMQGGDALSYGSTYYWRVRAQDANGSGNFGDWTEIQSMTIVEGVDLSDWYQTADGQFNTDTLTVAQVSGSGGAEVAIADNTEVLIAYGEGTNTTLKYRFWDGSNWGVEQDALDVGGQINIVVAAAGVTRDEYIVGTLDTNADANFQVYSASTSAWSDLNEFTTTASAATRRGIAVAYESDSGDAIAVACDGDADPIYSVWNGSSWNATGTIDFNSANDCEFLKLASNPNSDEIIVLGRDTGSQYEAQVWDGDSWSESQILGSMQSGQENREGMAVAYEESGNQALVITTNNTGNNFIWNSWNGTTWGANTTEGLGNDFEFGNLKSDIGTDRLALCYIDEANDIGVVIWDGDAWGAETELTVAGNNDQGRPIDCEFETTAGRDGYIVAPYSDTVDDQYQYFSTSTWSGELDVTDITDSWFVQTERAGDGVVLAVYSDDIGDSYESTYFNGTSWSTSQSLETNPSVTGNPIPESFMMTARRYQSAVGTIVSTPVAHSAVPNQATWGDAYFSTTETSGTDVQLQVYYTSTTTCDVLVPDGDLSGNASGFDVSASPINISGLATTTYSEICLKATLTQAGGSSPTLDDWRITWQRTPYITQNYFQWFVNGSFFTPTDAWPAGVSDLAENIAISDEEPVDNEDSLRLRMSLLNENIDFSASGDTFKLQYAEASTCSLDAQWFDVGDAASTTALWRGYSNSIVGSDWYDGDWGRRIEITVDNTLVDDDVTDFPVYVDLGDLPSGFFSNVQSDGDDIRITEGDGLTELPYELVSINTGSQTGELHFKADLSSTTDSMFFIYYENAGASGYSAGATYGSQNVWTNNFSLRYALDDDPTGSSPQFLDSTSNSSDAVALSGMTAGDVISGQIGESIDLDGTDGGVFQTPLAFTGEFTFSTWWYQNSSVGDGRGFAVSTNAGATEKIGPWTGGNVFVRTISSSDQSVSNPSDDAWHHIVVTRDSSNKVDLYIDGGAPNRLYGDVAQSGTSDWENFGGQSGQRFEGSLDELRFASVKRSDGWVTTEFNNQSNATGFYSVSNEELVSDGRELPSALLSVTDVLETYEEESPTALNPNAIPAGSDGEWDFVLQNNNASSSTQYCFRMVYADGGLLDTYAYYPQLITNAPPIAPTLSAPFDNEQLASTSPFFEFSADDAAGDDVRYQIQVDDDYDFGSVAIDKNSIAPSTQFENLGTPSDKDPFTSGQTVRFTSAATLSDSTTYWWRVRALDPDGSNTYGDWSTPNSFTVEASTTITTWLQTTDEQFETNTLTFATTTGSDDVEIDSSGATSVSILDGFTTGNSKTVSDGTNRMLVVGVHSEDSTTNVDVDSVTYGGQTLTQIQDVQIGATPSNGMWVGYLLEDDVALASGNSISVSWASSVPDTSVMYSSVVFENVSQVDPVPDDSSNSGTGVSSIQPSASISASDGDMTAYFVVSGSSGDTHTAPGGYTEGTEEDNGLGVAANAYKAITSGSSEQPTATLSDVQNRMAIISFVANNDASGKVVSTAIDFDDRDTGNAWGQAFWNDTETDGTILYRVEYYTGSSWVVIPDSVIANNSVGTSTSPINLLGLDTDIYNQIRLVADMSGADLSVQDWSVEWGQRVETPTLIDPFDNAKVATTTPTFRFTTTDPEDDAVEYQFSFSTSSAFSATTTRFSGTDLGFASIDQPASSSPFASGDTITYTIQQGDALTSSSTYWWRVRARDSGGSNQWSLWSSPESFTVDESIAVSVWFQTTGEQFQTDTLTDTEGDTVDEEAQISTVLREAMVAYGEGAVQSPRYQIWDGSAWGGELTAQSVGARIEWTALDAAPTRDEYALATLGTDGDVNIQIYSGASSTWANLFELETENTNTGLRGYDIAYETSSGDLMAVACEGTEAVYAIWDGASWSATSSLSLTNANTCLWTKLASDPVSDELIVVTRSSNASSNDYEAQVWNGSSWGNAVQFGEMGEDAHEGIAVEYEESGGQAVVVVSNGTSGNTLIYDIWNGSSWAGSATHAIGDDFEWGQLVRDDGTDNMALCYIDQDSDIGLLRWTGSAFQSFQELELAGNARQGRPVSCQFETSASRDGYIMIPYSDNGALGAGDGGKYQFWATSTFSGEGDLGNIEDSYNVTSIRTDDGLVMAVFFDDINDQYDFTYWDGSSWSTEETLEDTPSVTGAPFHESLALAARIYPAFTSGIVRSTSIDYDDGTGPRWEQFLFNDTTPGASSITYQLYYQNATSSFVLIPDSQIPGNSSGTTTSPVSLAGLDRTIYNELQLQANLTCDSGDCPSIQDWSVEWSEGIIVSGTAYEYDESTVQTSGSVAIAVNGVLQSGKTGTIGGDGTWSINNVTVFEGDTVLVFIDGVVADVDEALAATQYDGNGDMSGMELSKRHLTIGSNDIGVVVANDGLAGYDSVDNENVFFTVEVGNALDLCGDVGCFDNELKILPDAVYQPGANSTIHDLENEGTLALGTSTLRLSGSYINNATSTPGTGVVMLTATSTTETISGSSTMNFYGLTFGETSGSATWSIPDGIDVNDTLTVSFGTLARATSAISIGGDASIAAGGSFTGIGTTTFDGTGTSNWSDATASSTNIGNVVVDGTSKTTLVVTDVRVESLTINADDVLRGGTGNTLYVNGDFINNNSFVDDTSTVAFAATSSAIITANGSDFYDVDFVGAGGNWSFTDTDIVVANDVTIATGTVTLPTDTMQVGGSFFNTGGVFAHNNGTTTFTSGASGEQIGLLGDSFLNAFYNVSFSGAGEWTFTDTNATTSNVFTITNGNVVLPSGSLTVGADFSTSGGGSFAHNNGEVILLVTNADTITTNGSSLYDVRVRNTGGSSWYNESWLYRVPITIDAAVIDDDLVDFPVYVDLANLPTDFFSNVLSGGGDIRVTESDGQTEVPREIVSIDTGSENGELHFQASDVSSTTDSVFYIYYGNSGASDYAVTDTYGAENVWSNGYVLVAHMDDLTTSTVLNSANGSLNGTKASAGNPNETTTGKLYEAQEDGATDHIAFGNVGAGAGEITISAWFNADDFTPGGDSNTYGATIFSAHASGQYTWLTAGGTASPDEIRFCAFSSSATCNVGSGSNLSINTWHYVSAASYDGGSATARVDGTEVLSFTSDGGGTWNSDSTIGDLRPNRNIEFDGELDEIQISNVVRSTAYQDATYRNQATTTDFYTTGGQQVPDARTFADTNTVILGDLNVESGDAVLPGGTLQLGGSLSNQGEFDANGGTVLFNSADTGETIDTGVSSFATAEFDSSTGGWTFVADATSTTALLLTNVGDFTAGANTLESTGIFTNNANGASTTWTGSELKLSSNSDFLVNTSTSTGDVYNTLLLTGDTGARFWNSSASTYTTQDTSSIYSQDHAGASGDLYIFGDYERTTGTEYWSYATDFDGTDLTGGAERQVDVRVEGGGSVTLSTSTLAIVGSSTASTTIDSQSGTFALTSVYATVTAQYFAMTGTDIDGLNLTSSSTITLLDDALFTIGTGVSSITVDGTTIDTNPAAQFFNTNFVTGGGSANVTLSGAPSSYWWFRNGQGDRYGEAFDNADGDPGSIRWDDSSYNIIVSGTVYADDEGSTLGGPTCDGSTTNVRIVVDGGAYASSTSCSGVDGSYSFPTVAYVGDPSIVVYLDTNGGVQGSVVTKTPTADVTNLDIYANRVITRHEDVTALTIADMATYDNNDDADIRFAAATSTTDTLTVLSDTELYVFATTTFTPGGVVTLESGGTGNPYDGSLLIANGATFVGAGTTTYSVGGVFEIETGGTFTSASSTVLMTATTSGKAITGGVGETINFNTVRFTGVGGAWNINADIAVAENMHVATGTVTGTGNITVTNGSFYGDGLVSLGAGTTTLTKTNTLGGAQGWTFNDLTLGTGSFTGTTTPGSSATTTVNGVLTIGTGHYLDAGASLWELGGSGDVFIENGTFLEDTSTVVYSGSTGANIFPTEYYNLKIAATAGTPTFTFSSTAMNILNDLTVAGAVSTIATLTVNDPVVQVDGDVFIDSNGSLLGSDTSLLTVLGSWDNDGSFTGNGGEVQFGSSDAFTIAAGSSAFSDLTLTGSGAVQFTENATSTGTLTYSTTTNPTVNSGVTLAVGTQFLNQTAGVNTTWTDSVLYLYGGDYEINASTTADTYATIHVGPTAAVRMWNSSAATTTVDSSGSLYSMDHADVTGDLYIFGDYVEAARSDYWSYATDFDGTDISGGGERQVDVYIEGSGSVTHTGGSLIITGSSTATTTIQNQGSGTYSLDITGTSTFTGQYVQVRDIDSDGVTFSGTPTVSDFSYSDFLVEINSGSAITVGGTVINANPAKNFQRNIFNDDIGVTGAVNITATGTSVSSWRNTNHDGDIAGEGFDSDPAGDPGYLVWDDSAAIITISGNVYQSDTSSVSSVCDDSTTNIQLAVDGVLTASASSSCASADGAYSISGISFSPNDTLTLYIAGETQNAATVSIDPISSIGDMHLYEDHVIVRHENTDPVIIADLDDWDSGDTAGDIPFTAEVVGTPSVTLPTDTKLIVWNNKEFAPGGDVTVSGGGAGAAYDGTVELFAGSTFTAGASQSHVIGGSLIVGSGATYDANGSTVTFTTTGAGRTVDVNSQPLYDVIFNGSGSWTVTDTTFAANGDVSIISGDVTLPSATSTFAGSFENTGGTFDANGGLLYFTATSSGHNVAFGGSSGDDIQFEGISGGWTITDTNATTTGSLIISAGDLTLPSGTLSVGGDFINADTLTHNSGELRLVNTSGSSIVTLQGEDLYTLTVVGGANFTMTDASAALLGDLTIASGTLAVSTTTLSVGGSLDATGGIMDTASGTILFNSADTGESISPGSNVFYNVAFGNTAGGWTIEANATATNNFNLSSANSFTQQSGTSLYIGNVFTNLVGGGATTWTNSTLVLDAASTYEINTKSLGGDIYGTLVVGNNTDISAWNSSAVITSVAQSGSLYSQDHANVNGDLYIYGDYHVSTTTEYWSYATDFDGTALGSPRIANVYIDNNASTTVDGGALQIVGIDGASTTIQGIVDSNTFAFAVQSGTLNASYYTIENTNTDGLYITNTPTISNLSNGAFLLTADTGSAITITAEALNANASKIFNNVGFSASSSVTGFNVELTAGTTSNAWKFTGSYGDISGELFDSDGADNCGSIRWDDSSCLLVEQTHYRWRNDDGGLGVPNSEWFDNDWGKRKRVRITNQDAQTYSSTSVKIAVTHDTDMQSDFEDLRFTDNDGLTEIPYWIEEYTASTDASVWVRIPSLPASTDLDVFMYYDNVLATSTASSGATFVASDDFEDGDIAEYTGDTGLFTVDGSFAYGGSNGLDTTGFESSRATDGIGRTDQTVSQGEIVRYMQYVDTGAGSVDEACTLFGVQSVTGNTNYGVCLEQFGTDRMSLARNIESTDSYGSVIILATTTVSYTTGWYEVEVDWQTDDTIDVSLYTAAGALVATTSATDSTYTSGGYGFTYWGQNGGWDSFTSRPRVETPPAVVFGAEQTNGGATWNRGLDLASTGFEVADIARLRIAIENSGLDITDQEFLLEYAEKGTAPSCESVSPGSYASVPAQASCGSSPLCMVASSNFSDGASTFDLLEGTNGAFTAGEAVEDPSNLTGLIDVDQNEYTEVEYALSSTVNATADAYCLRVTDSGSDLDSYAAVAELHYSLTQVWVMQH